MHTGSLRRSNTGGRGFVQMFCRMMHWYSSSYTAQAESRKLSNWFIWLSEGPCKCYTCTAEYSTDLAGWISMWHNNAIMRWSAGMRARPSSEVGSDINETSTHRVKVLVVSLWTALSTSLQADRATDLKFPPPGKQNEIVTLSCRARTRGWRWRPRAARWRASTSTRPCHSCRRCERFASSPQVSASSAGF